MANALYPLGKQALLTAGFNLSTDTIQVVLVPSTYTYSSAHQYLTALTTLGTAVTLASKTVALGVFDAADPYFTAVPGGSTAQAMVVFKSTGDSATSPLLAYIDTITGFPVATNGGDISVVLDNGAYRLFSL